MNDYIVYWKWNGEHYALLRVLSRAEAERIAKEKNGGYVEWDKWPELSEKLTGKTE